MAYDHHEKAGNQGDIVKHPALIAALHETVSRAKREPFRYADTFAAYAVNPLLKGNQWARGIGVVAGKHLLAGNRHVASWARWFSLDREPIEGGTYPGSTLIAKTVGDHLGKRVELSMWDTSPAAAKDLRENFGDQEHGIYDRPAEPDEAAIKNANFLFIDPPDKTFWNSIFLFLSGLNAHQSVLVWLPMGPDTTSAPPAEDRTSALCRQEALDLPGFRASRVRWAKGGHTIGCQLLYRLNAAAADAVREAVDEIADQARWRDDNAVLGATHF